MSVHYRPAGGFKAVHSHDLKVIEDVQSRRPYGNEPGSSKRERRSVSKGNKRVKK